MAESTPFLPAVSSNNVDPEPTSNSAPSANPPTTQTIARLTDTSLFGSLFSLTMILAAYTLYIISPLYSWSLESDLGGLAFFIALGGLLSLLNRASIRSSNSTPLTLNLIFDLILVFSIGAFGLRLVIDATRDLADRNCGNNWDSHGEVKPNCMRWLILTCSLCGAALLGALVVGISHLTLLLIRATNLWRSRFWSRPLSRLVLADQQLKIEINFRVVRSRVEPAVGAGQSASTEESANADRLVEV